MCAYLIKVVNIWAFIHRASMLLPPPPFPTSSECVVRWHRREQQGGRGGEMTGEGREGGGDYVPHAPAPSHPLADANALCLTSIISSSQFSLYVSP